MGRRRKMDEMSSDELDAVIARSLRVMKWSIWAMVVCLVPQVAAAVWAAAA